MEAKRVARVATELGELAWEMEEYLPQTRVRRGLVNAGGSVIKFLFGNPDADDLGALQQGLAWAKAKTDRIVQLERKKLIVSRGFSRKIQENALGLRDMAQGVVNLTRLAIRQQNQLTRLENTVNRTLGALYALNRLEWDLEGLKTEV